MPLDLMTRKDLHADYMANPAVYVAMATEKKWSLPYLFNRLAPEAEKHHPEDAFQDILFREELEVAAGTENSSSDVERWLDQTDKEVGPKETLFWAQLDKDYDDTSTIGELAWKQNGGLWKQNAATTLVTDNADNTPLNPRSYRQLYERSRFAPPIAIADIASGLETIPNRTFGQPEYRTDAADERSRVIGEGLPMDMTTIVTGERTGKLKKIGGGLRVSLEYEMDQTRMSSVRMWVARKAMRDEIRIVNEGVNVLANNATTENIGSSPNARSIREVNLYFSQNSGYRIDLLCAKKEEADKWIEAHQVGGQWSATPAQNSVITYNRPVPAGQFTDVTNTIEVVNFTSGPNRLAIFDDTTTDDPDLGTALVDNELLGIDTRFGLILYQQARGVLSEERYDPRTQVRERFISRWFGWFLQDPDARVSFRYA